MPGVNKINESQSIRGSCQGPATGGHSYKILVASRYGESLQRSWSISISIHEIRSFVPIPIIQIHQPQNPSHHHTPPISSLKPIPPIPNSPAGLPSHCTISFPTVPPRPRPPPSPQRPHNGPLLILPTNNPNTRPNSPRSRHEQRAPPNLKTQRALLHQMRAFPGDIAQPQGRGLLHHVHGEVYGDVECG